MTGSVSFLKTPRKIFATCPRPASDPFLGNVKALQGEEWKDVFRRRIGDYRILFTTERKKEIVHVLRILLCSGKTYR